MMPNLTTPVIVLPLPFKVDYSTGIVSLGSCFADEIGARLQEGDFHVEQNPFGALYNPASIAAAVRRLMEDREIGMEDLVEHEGLWHSWHHHGSFSKTTPEETLAACNDRIHQAHNALKEASLLMVTFGTAWVFEHEGEIVANCHKLPPQMFVRRRMTVDEIVALWQPLLQELAAYYPKLNVLFTVSPIRHMADGAHGNQLSKSTLLLAIDQLVSTFNFQFSISYFPAYEIVLDELRDYRFYDEKMTHPTSLAVDVVWERFQSATMAPAVREQAHCNAKQHKREKHIPLHG
jgi:hypothetical protein